MTLEFFFKLIGVELYLGFFQLNKNNIGKSKRNLREKYNFCITIGLCCIDLHNEKRTLNVSEVEKTSKTVLLKYVKNLARAGVELGIRKQKVISIRNKTNNVYSTHFQCVRI
uniref:Uncharacterized protein n=1 Tax=Cacopsylla melanoneura TaxID=428564 RepID=A0A8D8V484_9HEMI